MTHQRIQAEIFDPAGQRQRRETIHALVRAALRSRFLDEAGHLVDRLAFAPAEKRCRLWAGLALLAGDDNDRALANTMLAALPLTEPCHFALLASAMILNRHQEAICRSATVRLTPPSP